MFYIIIFIYSHGIDFDDHGYYNFFGSVALIILLLLGISPLNCFVYILRSNNKIYFFIFILGLIFIWLTYALTTNYYINCSDWNYGLNNSYIENNKHKHGCIIIYPKTCPYKLGKFLFDESKKNRKVCIEKRDTKKKLLDKSENYNINYKTNRIGYPVTNNDKIFHKPVSINSDYLIKRFKNHLIDMDNQTLIENIEKKKFPEIIIDYNKNPLGELIINLYFNKTLSIERKLLESNSTPYSNNIIILFIDSVSRAYSVRSLKKTLNFFEQFMKYKGSYNKNESDNFHSFQFFKYHSFSYYTRYNYPNIFYGKSKGKLVRNIKYLKENGYITCFVNDMCNREPTNTMHNMTDDEISDHEMLICDPNMEHISSTSVRCLYNKLTTFHALEYGNQFWRKYKTNRKYLIINLEDGHEGSLEVLKYSDDIIYNFLNSLYSDNLLKGTSVFLLSDHGTNLPSPYYAADFYHIERYLPMFYLLCNDRENISYEQQYMNLNNNQQILITGYDIYNTIGNLVFGDKYDSIKNKTEEYESPKSEYGISLFNKINSKERTPSFYSNMTDKVCLIKRNI